MAAHSFSKQKWPAEAMAMAGHFDSSIARGLSRRRGSPFCGPLRVTLVLRSGGSLAFQEHASKVKGVDAMVMHGL